MKACRVLITVFALGLVIDNAYGQMKTSMGFEEYNPVSTLVVPEHIVKASRFPFIDIHNHQPEMEQMDLSVLLRQMDSLNMKVMVNLTGKGGVALKRMIENINRNDRKRL